MASSVKQLILRMLRAYGGLFSALYLNMPAMNGLSMPKPFDSGKSTEGIRCSSARRCSRLDATKLCNISALSLCSADVEWSDIGGTVLLTEGKEVRPCILKDIFYSPRDRNLKTVILLAIVAHHVSSIKPSKNLYFQCLLRI